MHSLTRRKQASGDSAGFTLIEVMAAMAILSIAMVILLEAHAASIRISDTARKMSTAAALARDLTTEFELQGFPSPGTESGDFSQWYPGLYIGYRWEIEVTESMFWQNVREVYIKVLWKEGPDDRSIELVNFIAAMNEEDQDIAAMEGSGSSASADEMMGALQNAADSTKGGVSGGAF